MSINPYISQKLVKFLGLRIFFQIKDLVDTQSLQFVRIYKTKIFLIFLGDKRVDEEGEGGRQRNAPSL